MMGMIPPATKHYRPDLDLEDPESSWTADTPKR